MIFTSSMPLKDLAAFEMPSRTFMSDVRIMRPTAPPRALEMRTRTPPQDSIGMTQPSWMALLNRNIEGLQKLGAGWDGPRSVSVSSDRLNLARKLVLEAIAPLSGDVRAPSIVPLANGGVQIEWHTRKGELELELAIDGSSSLWVRDHSTGHELDAEGAKAVGLFLQWAPRLAAGTADALDVQAPQAGPFIAAAA